MSPLEELERINKLREQGALSQEEFEQLKKKILDEQAAAQDTEPAGVAPEPVIVAEERIEEPEPVRETPVYVERTEEATPRKRNLKAIVLGTVAVVAVLALSLILYINSKEEKIASTSGPAVTTEPEQFNEGGNPFSLSDSQIAQNDIPLQPLTDTVNYNIVYPPDIIQPQAPKNPVKPARKDTSSLSYSNPSASVTGTDHDTAGSAIASAKQSSPQNEINSDSEQEFSSEDGQVAMKVNTDADQNEDLNAKYEKDIYRVEEGKKITYKVKKDDFYVVSGYKGDKVFYKKTIVKNGKIKNFYIEYPASQKSKMDPVTVKMSRSFK